MTCELAGAFTLGPSECGIHVVGWLADGPDERAIRQRATEVAVGSLSTCYLGAEKESGLVLGFANGPADASREAVGVLGEGRDNAIVRRSAAAVRIT